MDIQTAIQAENGTLIGWDPDLIEPQEITLIQDLENWVKNQFERWNNVQFAMSDNLYCASFFMVLYMQLLPKFMNLRLERCKTNEVHSFHIRMYLASHHELDRFMPYLTLKQQLWLYRNILYIERNFGHSSQFYKLIERILTERDIPIGEYTVRQLDDFTQYFSPVLQARMRLINDNRNALSVSYHPLPELFDKEEPLAPGNPLYYETYADRDFRRFETHNSSVTKTKDLMSSMVDYSNAIPEPFEMVALREWCHMASIGYYDVVINFRDVKTSEMRNLFAKDAFIYMSYLSLMADGIEVLEVPRYLNMQFRRIPKPSHADLMSVMGYQRRDWSILAQAVLDGQPNPQPFFSITSFNTYLRQVTEQAYWHWFVISATEDLYDRGEVENMIRRLYANEMVEFDVETTDMADWLAMKNLPSYDLTRDEALAQVQELYETAVGYRFDASKSPRNIQRALIDLLTTLSSYSIQFIREINDSDVIPLNWPAVRLGDPRQSQSEYRSIEAGVEVLEGRGHSQNFFPIEAVNDVGVHNHSAQYTLNRQITVGTDMVTETIVQETYSDYGNSPDVGLTYPGQDVELEKTEGVFGLTLFEALPESAKQTIKSKYQSPSFNQ